MSSIHKVFVYGTLKTGEPNNDWFSMNPDGRYKLLGKAKTAEKYPLIIGSKHNIPFLLYQPGTGFNVQGELYEVDDLVLRNLDLLEEYPQFYVREQRDVVLLKSNGDEVTHTPWIYFIKQFRKDLLKQKMFESYSHYGDHGLRYLERDAIDESVTLKDLN